MAVRALVSDNGRACQIRRESISGIPMSAVGSIGATSFAETVTQMQRLLVDATNAQVDLSIKLVKASRVVATTEAEQRSADALLDKVI